MLWTLWKLCSILFYAGWVQAKDRPQTNDCVRRGELLECTGYIPLIVPGNISEVYVKDYNREPFTISTFEDISWSYVEMFNIHINEQLHFNTIRNNTFSHLSKLTHLKLQNSDLSIFDESALVGLDNLEILDLSECVGLEIGSLVTALNNQDIAPRLHTLLLDSVDSKYSKYSHIGQDFFDMIVLHNITKLSLANMKLYFKTEIVGDTLPVLDLNMSHVNIFYSFKNNLNHLFSKLNVLDVSGYEYRSPQAQDELIECSRDRRFLFSLPKLERIYANNVKWSFGVSKRSKILDINATECSDVKIQVIHFRASNIESFSFSGSWSKKASKVVVDMDMSENMMRYFYIEGHMPVLKLNLAWNRLNQMETHPKFAYAFKALPFLEEIILESNGLQSLPRDIFLHNPQLRFIQLQDNRMTMLTFGISHLRNLRVLNLTGNIIKVIDKSFLLAINDIQTIQQNQNNTPILKVDFRNNMLECSCERHAFVKWVLSKQSHTADPVYDLYCTIGDQQPTRIDENAERHVDFLCKRTMIISLSSSMAVFLVIACSILISLWVIRMRKRQKICFIEQFRQRKTKERFLAMLSHSQRDKDIVYNGIRARLEDAMRKEVPIEDDLLGLGDVHFRPGFALIDDIHKLVSESCVAIFVISRHFCESGYCWREMKEAYVQDRPIILMFLEEVDENNMTPLMQSIFYKVSRVKITLENGNVVSTPSWESLTQSVITLATHNRSPMNACSCTG